MEKRYRLIRVPVATNLMNKLLASVKRAHEAHYAHTLEPIPPGNQIGQTAVFCIQL